MPFSIGEVSDMTGIAVSALRYYDREGLFPNMERSNGGIRLFSEGEIETLRIIECLKMTGMPIRDIRQFLDWCQEGDSTLELRRDMFYERLEIMNQKMAELNQVIDTIKFKCRFYDLAVASGSAEVPEKMSRAEIMDGEGFPCIEKAKTLDSESAVY